MYINFGLSLFLAKKYKKVTGKEIYSDTLESTPMLEKEKFPQDYFPEVCTELWSILEYLVWFWFPLATLEQLLSEIRAEWNLGVLSVGFLTPVICVLSHGTTYQNSVRSACEGWGQWWKDSFVHVNPRKCGSGPWQGCLRSPAPGRFCSQGWILPAQRAHPGAMDTWLELMLSPKAALTLPFVLVLRRAGGAGGSRLVVLSKPETEAELRGFLHCTCKCRLSFLWCFL